MPNTSTVCVTSVKPCSRATDAGQVDVLRTDDGERLQVPVDGGETDRCAAVLEQAVQVLGALEPVDAVSYTHLTLPTNREV